MRLMCCGAYQIEEVVPEQNFGTLLKLQKIQYTLRGCSIFPKVTDNRAQQGSPD